MTVQLQKATQYYYYKILLLECTVAIFLVISNKINAQIWPSGVWGRGWFLGDNRNDVIQKQHLTRYRATAYANRL